MSSEVVKKRGRPKKVIPELLDAKVTEVVKKTTRTKSTKAAPKTSKAKALDPSKAIPTKQSVSKTSSKAVSTPIAPSAPSTIAATAVSSPIENTRTSKPVQADADSLAAIPTANNSAAIPTANNSATIPTKPTQATKSPILTEVQKLNQAGAPSIKPANVQGTSTDSAKPLQSNVTMKTQSATSMPLSTSKSSKNPPSAPPKPKIPIAALNSAVVSNISTRAGARPNTAGSSQLPPNYKSVSRKVTMAIVAMPIVIVTSYVLYQRLVLGEERKLLSKDRASPPAPTGTV